MIGRDVSIPQHQRRSNGRHNRPPRLYRLGDILLAYVAALLVNAAAVATMPPLMILTYPMTGILFSRYIGNRIVWWPFAANLETVASTKLRLILTWPVSVPTFAWQLFVVKFL
jgi:hypothetical protein